VKSPKIKSLTPKNVKNNCHYRSICNKKILALNNFSLVPLIFRMEEAKNGCVCMYVPENATSLLSMTFAVSPDE
jgi:hypothetical protein